MINDFKTKSIYFQFLLKTFNNHSQHRDLIFSEVLDLFGGKPIRILEIGSMTSMIGRYSNGNSTMFWALYLAKFGGYLITSNIDQEHLNTAKEVISSLEYPINVTYFFGQGEDILTNDNNFDLVYLDGACNSHDQLKQYHLCSSASYILCDDFHTKGNAIKETEIPYKLFKFDSHHEMALLHKEKITKREEVHIPWNDSKDENVLHWEKYLQQHQT